MDQAAGLLLQLRKATMIFVLGGFSGISLNWVYILGFYRVESFFKFLMIEAFGVC